MRRVILPSGRALPSREMSEEVGWTETPIVRKYVQALERNENEFLKDGDRRISERL